MLRLSKEEFSDAINPFGYCSTGQDFFFHKLRSSSVPPICFCFPVGPAWAKLAG